MPQSLAPDEAVPHGNAPTILLVEDEVLIRLAMADFLRSCGYVVLEAADAAEARALMEREVAVDLLWSDVQMPGPVDGLGLARWARARRPELRVVLASGMVRPADPEEFGPIEPKPYSEPVVLQRIRSLIGGS